MIQGIDQPDLIHKIKRTQRTSFSGHQSTVKVDGTIGINCNYLNVNTALIAGEKSIYLKNPKIITGTFAAAYNPGDVATINATAHGLLDGKIISVRSEEDSVFRYVEGLYTVAGVTLNLFTIQLINNGFDGSTVGDFTGRSGGGIDIDTKVTVHRTDATKVTFNSSNHRDISIKGEDKRYCTVGPIGDDAILIDNVDASGITIENIQLAPGASKRAIELGSTAEMTDFTFEDCMFNGFEHVVNNGARWKSLINMIQVGHRVENLKFINCDIWGASVVGDLGYVSFRNTSLPDKFKTVIFDGCDFRQQIDVRSVFIGAGSAGFTVIDCNFSGQYNIAINTVGATDSQRTKDHIYSGNFCRFGFETQHDTFGGLISAITVSIFCDNVTCIGNSIIGNDFGAGEPTWANGLTSKVSGVASRCIGHSFQANVIQGVDGNAIIQGGTSLVCVSNIIRDSNVAILVEAANAHCIIKNNASENVTDNTDN